VSPLPKAWTYNTELSGSCTGPSDTSRVWAAQLIWAWIFTKLWQPTPQASYKTQQHGVNLLDSNTGERFSPDSPSEKLLEAAFDAINLYAGEDWIMDSGALAHFSGDRTTFSNLDSTKQRSVTSAGGQSHYIEGQGVAEIALSNGEIKSIRDVQYVLGLYRNILSIGKIVDLGHLALFDQAACFIISKEKPFRVIAKGTRTPGNGFYMLTQLAQNLDYAQQIHSLADHNACSNLTPHTESDLQKS
jgi:hypothetical protein